MKGEQTIKLFFPDNTGKTLITETRVIPKTLSLAKESVIQWLKGPDLSSSEGRIAVNPVNPSTTLRDIALKNGIAVVDLSKEFLQAYGQAEPQVVLYGLVNTLTQYSTITAVSIRIEGQEIKTFRGQRLIY
jgi:spore germination protein GerM